MVTSERDLVDDIHVAADSMRRLAVDHRADQEVEIFEYEGDFVAATVEGNRRAQTRLDPEKGNQMVFRDHIIACLRVLKPNGAALSKERAPLAGDKITEAFLEASKHKFYKGQTLQALDKDGHEVVFRKR